MRSIALISFIVLGTACTPGNSPLYVDRVRPLLPMGTGCSLSDDENLLIRNLDLIDVAATPDFEVAAVVRGMADFFSVQSQPGIVLSSGNRLTADARDRITLTRILLRYSSRPAIPGITASLTDTIPITVVITREAQQVIVPVPLFGKNVRDQLAKLSPSNTDPPFQFVSTFELQGTTMSGAEVRTDPVPFPMNMVKSEVTCTSADTRLIRYTNPGVAASCQFAGLGQRLGPSSCCNQLDASGNPSLDFTRLGCDVLP
jgi:hypothetical protein